jgi:hypothetical protein
LSPLLSGALGGGLAGVLVQRFLDRPRLRPVVVAAGRASAPEDLTELIDVPDDLQGSMAECAWIGRQSPRVSGAEILEILTGLQKNLEYAPEGDALAGRLLDGLDAVPDSTEAKRHFLGELAPSKMINPFVVDLGLGLVDLRVTDDDLKGLAAVAEVSPEGGGDGAYTLYFGRVWLRLGPGVRHPGERLRLLADALARFHKPTIRALLQHAK